MKDVSNVDLVGAVILEDPFHVLAGYADDPDKEVLALLAVADADQKAFDSFLTDLHAEVWGITDEVEVEV
ncbi:MAG: hypothetical protein WC846_03045 [Candidatus Gracilibacteria bacterium]|jgi:hypothetical protein